MQPEQPHSGSEDVTDDGQAAVDRLRRWQDFGGVWRVESRTAGDVTISLCRCDGGEEIDRLTSNDPRLLRWLGARTSSDQ